MNITTRTLIRKRKSAFFLLPRSRWLARYFCFRLGLMRMHRATNSPLSSAARSSASVTATGTINPVTTVIVGSQLSGRVVEILADYNDKVTAGQILARLNSDQIRFKRDAAKADLDQARATQVMQEAKMAEADLSLGRQARLKPTGAVSDATYDAARTVAAVAQAQLQVNAGKIAQMEAVLRQVEVDLANTDIRSPMNGVIIQRSVELGATVAASLQSPTIFTIADDLPGWKSPPLSMRPTSAE